MQKNAPIGVLDSGVGGLSVLKCLQAALPQEDFIYVGDTASSRKKIGVFATEFTINSGAHKAAILAADDGADVYPQACPKFVPLIEGEQFDSAEVRAAVAEYAAPLKAAGIDTLILSCTHYPFIQKEIESEFGSEVTVIDPADATAQDTKMVLAAEGLLRSEGAGTLEVCFTADVERGARIAGRVLPQGKCLFKEIKL